MTTYRKYSKIGLDKCTALKNLKGKNNMELLKKIRVLCAEQGISVSKLERECGFSKNSVIKWSKNMPSGDKILRVAQYFGVTVDYLLGNNQTQESELPEMYFSFIRGAKDLDLSKKDLDLLLAVARRFKTVDKVEEAEE